MLDHPLLLDIFSLGAPQLGTGLGFLFFFKVSFEKHPNVHLRRHESYWQGQIETSKSNFLIHFLVLSENLELSCVCCNPLPTDTSLAVLPILST